MSVRFRKTVSLGKGARINFSKSGPSLNVGPRGASLSIGKRGVYANVGIPGTGISKRTRLTGSSSNYSDPPQELSPERQHAKAVLKSHAGSDGALQLEASLDRNGEICFIFTDTGENVTDKVVIREIKKLPEVKAALPALQERQKEVWAAIQSDSAEASREFIEIYKLSPKIVSLESFEDRLEKLKPKTYERLPFSQAKPTESDVRQKLYSQAEQNVKGIFGRRKKIEQYVDNHFDAYRAEALVQWDQSRLAFEKEEDEREISQNAIYEAEYEQKKTKYEAALSSDAEVICRLIESWLSGLTIPANVSAQLHYRDGRLYLNLDLPEIEDLPATTTKKLKSGQVKVVNKAQKLLKQEYATCVLGLALFMASSIFNLNANISEIWISGFTQRRNKEGDLDNEYIYSVKLPREQLRAVSIDDPIAAFDQFESRLKLSSTFALGKIKPYEPESMD